MAQIDELDRRITAAFDRIAAAIEALDSTQPVAPAIAEPEETEPLRTALEDERLANAQLEERLKTLRDRHEGDIQQLEAQIADQRAALAQMEDQMRRLQSALDQHRAASAALREAQAAGLADATLIDAALQAENDSLRAARSADRTEIDSILTAMMPLLSAAIPQEDETETAADASEDTA